jgi:hypothetical protein
MVTRKKKTKRTTGNGAATGSGKGDEVEEFNI